VFREALMTAHPVAGAADRPVENLTQNAFRVLGRQCDNGRNTHATAHQECAVDTQVIEEANTLGNHISPGHALDTAARLTGFATVEDDALEALAQIVERLDPRIDAERAPRFDRGIETARAVHQKRGPVTDHIVTRGNSVDSNERHVW